VETRAPATTSALVRYAGEFLDAVIERAEGAWLTTTDGRQILDFTSGQMCATLGHNHPAIVAAMADSADRVLHLFSGFLSSDVIALADELIELLPDELDRALFVTTGAESNEAAFRMAKMHTGGYEVVAFTGSWHGLTAGASSSTYSGGRRGYGPPMPGSLALPTPNCYRCPIQHCRDRCDLTCLDVGMSLVDSQSVGALAAVIVEPILSAGGIVPLPDGYLARLRAVCDARGALLIVDEAQTALGRVGAMFGFERHGEVPDILTLSKTLGGGLALAATVTRAAIEEHIFEKGYLHFTSHVSDPLPANVGRAVLATVVAEDFAGRARRLGTHLRRALEQLQSRHEQIGQVRGEGMMLGVDLVQDRDSREPAEAYGTAVTARALELGLNVNIVKFPGFGSVLRIAPPLTIREEDLDAGVEILDRALAECAAAQ
jgi:2,2-dialkylglycine decarboxylase (pyruvate)